MHCFITLNFIRGDSSNSENPKCLVMNSLGVSFYTGQTGECFTHLAFISPAYRAFNSGETKGSTPHTSICQGHGRLPYENEAIVEHGLVTEIFTNPPKSNRSGSLTHTFLQGHNFTFFLIFREINIH